MKIPARRLALAISGVGLILFGLAALLLIPLSRARNNLSAASDFSAIPVEVRFDAPALTLTDMQAARHSLSDYRGQVVLVNLWATWCPPCRAEMPNLQNYYLKHQGEGLVVVAIDDGDPSADVISFVDELGLTFPVWLDPAHQATDHAFKTMNLPSSYVIDRAGKVRWVWAGAISPANLEKYVTPLVKEQ